MVVSWECANCGTETKADEGGICSVCGNFHCHSCLFFEKGQRKKGPVCGKCTEKDKKYIRFSRAIPSTVESRRKVIRPMKTDEDQI